MAIVVLNAALDGSGRATVGGPISSSAALDAAMAVLVADGASPTQAHVTTANAALTAYKAVTGVVVQIDLPTAGTVTKLIKLFRHIETLARNSGQFTE